MNKTITIENSKSYATEANLMKALERLGLDEHPARRIICRNDEGRWTAIFMAGEYCDKEGGYVGFASQYGFMSV